MEKDLIKFYKNITNISKDICKYEDEKGNLTLVATATLFVGCEYLELDEPQYKQALFEGIITKALELPKTKATRVVSKDTITGKEKDRTTVVDKEVEVSQVWIVKNGLGIKKAYNKKEEALKFVRDTNNKFLTYAEQI